MPLFKQQQGSEPKKAVKRCYDENARKNVISLRISDDEMATLARISRTTSKSISDIMREALKGWQAQCRCHCLDA